MNALQRVREARMKLKARGASEHSNSEAIEDLFSEAQKIIADMNEAKLKAMKEAEAPYLVRLEAIDKEMAMFIALVA